MNGNVITYAQNICLSL